MVIEGLYGDVYGSVFWILTIHDIVSDLPSAGKKNVEEASDGVGASWL